MTKKLIALTAVALLLCGCAQPTPRGGSAEQFEGPGQMKTEGHASSEPEDYRDVLSNPGPF